MNIRALLLKHIKKTVRKREFWFTILLYPAIAAEYLYLKSNRYLYEFASKTGIWYFVVTFILLVFIIFYVSFEIIEKRLFHKVQGDKLKIKQQEQKWR